VGADTDGRYVGEPADLGACIYVLTDGIGVGRRVRALTLSSGRSGACAGTTWPTVMKRWPDGRQYEPRLGEPSASCRQCGEAKG